MHGQSTWYKKYHALDNFMGGNTNGFLDTTAGITLADKVGSSIACAGQTFAKSARPAPMHITSVFKQVSDSSLAPLKASSKI